MSYAGLMTMVYYDAESGRVHSMNAAFDVPLMEQDPLSIPLQGSGEPSGRTALVPGLMAGVAAAHERFGRLPFADLFTPAIHFAEQGFDLPAPLAGMIERRRDVLSRLPETRRVFAGTAGDMIAEGDRFKQPELAATLRAVAREGAAYMYTGPWAERLVATVQEEGGRLSLEDLAGYEVAWSEPVRTEFAGYQVCAAGRPGMGGVNTVEALNLLERAGLDALLDAPEDFFWTAQVLNVMALSFLDAPVVALLTGGRGADPETRTTKEWAGWLWERMRDGEFTLARTPEPGSHSDAIIAVDRWGNVAAVVHSINTSTWGETGIFVDGVSIPDAAAYQQILIRAAGAGERLPDPTNPLIVLRDGRPVLASSSIGAGLHGLTVLSVARVLGEGLDPAGALERPVQHLPAYDDVGRATVQVGAGDFTPELLDAVRALGQPVDELDATAVRGVCGYWLGARLGADGEWVAASPANLNGWALAE